jgi:NADH-quinone oxidoreductase subunit N
MTTAAVHIPHIDYKGLSPLIALIVGSMIVLLVGLIRGRLVQRVVMPVLTAATLLTAIGLTLWVWDPGVKKPIVANALSIDTLTLGLSMLFFIAGLATILLSVRSEVVRVAGGGEYYSLLLASITGMVLLAGADNLITLFIGIELLSIPLYVLCGSRVKEEKSLEAGLKYLVIGSVGSATLLYGLALIYGATSSTNLPTIVSAIGNNIGATVAPDDPLLLTGIALALAGLAFKASVAPFHTWTPDVYQGAPTPITTFMAVATKTAAFAIILRLFDSGLIDSHTNWAPAVAALAAVTIVVGNVGAIAQRSLKRMLGWSGVAQAGYMLAGVVVGTQLGLQAVAFYLAVYLFMNVAAFAVVIARERANDGSDDLNAFEGLGRASPWLAWPMTIAMLALAGFPATAGFIGKFYLIRAAVEGDYTWLAIMIVIGSMISLGYYLRVIAVMWMTPLDVELPTTPPRWVPSVGGWSPLADARRQPEVLVVALLAAGATIFFGIVPQPLFDVARDVGTALGSLL